MREKKLGRKKFLLSPFRIRIDLRFPSFLLKFPSLKKSTRNSGEGSQAVQGGGGKKRHRIDETRQVTNNNLGRGERDPPLFLPFVSKISRTMDAPPPPPLVRVRCRHRTCVSRGINGFRGRGTKGGMEGRKEEGRGRKTGVDPSR